MWCAGSSGRSAVPGVLCRHPVERSTPRHLKRRPEICYTTCYTERQPTAPKAHNNKEFLALTSCGRFRPRAPFLRITLWPSSVFSELTGGVEHAGEQIRRFHIREAGGLLLHATGPERPARPLRERQDFLPAEDEVGLGGQSTSAESIAATRRALALPADAQHGPAGKASPEDGRVSSHHHAGVALGSA